MGGIYEVAIEMGSVDMIYTPSFIKIGSGIQKLFFHNKENRLKNHSGRVYISERMSECV
jgi:hypothetical protein